MKQVRGSQKPSRRRQDLMAMASGPVVKLVNMVLLEGIEEKQAIYLLNPGELCSCPIAWMAF